MVSAAENMPTLRLENLAQFLPGVEPEATLVPPPADSGDVGATELLDVLSLGARKANRPGALSGGERQRLALARAMANRPTILLADEPTGSLDSAGGLEILELLRRFHAHGQTILVVTHDEAVAEAAQSLVIMRDGQIQREDPPRSSNAATAARDRCREP